MFGKRNREEASAEYRDAMMDGRQSDSDSSQC